MGSGVAKLGTNLVGRALLNGGGSAAIGAGTKLGQNAIKRSFLCQPVGIWDGVRENAGISGILGAAGSGLGDVLEAGVNASRNAINKELAKQAYNQLPLDLKLLSKSITSYKPQDHLPSIAGTLLGNIVANSSPLTSGFLN